MKRARILVVAVLMAVPVLGATATPAHACAGSWVCDTVNRICNCIP